MHPQTRSGLARDLNRLGLEPDDVVLVHASMRRLGWVVGGAHTVVHALRDAIGDGGTLVVPTLTVDNSDPGSWARTRQQAVPEAWWDTIREHLPAFDPAITPSWRMGAIAEAVRTWPEAVRSVHPQSSFAAVGPQARTLMAVHALDSHYGNRSPLASLVAADAKILLLGVAYEVCTAFHHAEYSLPTRPPQRYRCVIADAGGRRWTEYEDVVLDDADFADLGAALEASPAGHAVSTGPVGEATCRLLPVRTAVDFAITWLTVHRTAQEATEPSCAPAGG
jgi:aminoglycoside 3-N-acetyltransferase